MDTKQDDKPIPGPSSVGSEYVFEPDWDRPLGPALGLGRKIANLVRIPARWIRENFVEPYRGPKYYWYHRKYDRALPIDECYFDDHACMHEAHLDYKRNYLVDRATLDILRWRRDNCHYWNLTTKDRFFVSENCQDLEDTYDREEINFFIKYGDMHFGSTALFAYNKQKNRMIMERRKALKEREKQEAAEEVPA